MQIRLMPAEDAENAIAAVLGGRDDVLCRDVRTLIRVFHERHVGIPPAFALDLACGIAEGRPRNLLSPLRQGLYARLLEALAVAPHKKQDPRHFDRLPRHLMIDICVFPLAALVVEAMGETILFSRHDGPLQLEQAEYDAYSARFDETLKSFLGLSENDGSPARAIPAKVHLFFEKAAHQLVGEMRKLTPQAGRPELHALSRHAIDGLTLRMICGLNPRIRLDLDSDDTRMDESDEQNPLFSHPKQAGVVGIHTSSRLDDIEDMLLSEFMVPPVLLADKLLNSSFMAKHRPPPFDERKQVAILGIALDQPSNEAVALAKTCWLDAVFRLAIILLRNELGASQLRFGQSISDVGMVRSGVRVDAHRPLADLDPSTATRTQMRRFLSDGGWLPAFLSLLPDLAGSNSKRPGKGRFHSWQEELQAALEALFPEAFDLEREGPRFKAALLVAFKVVDLAAAAQRAPDLVAGHGGMGLFSSLLECPQHLNAGAAFVFHDPAGRSHAISIGGEEGKPASTEALNETAAQLISVIFQFYWENIDG